MSGREAQGSLLFHGQRKPTQSSGRLGVLFSGSAPTAFCRDDSCGPRTDRNAKDLDHHKTERLSRFFLMWAKRSSSSGTARTKRDRKSTRLNSSHGYISYAVFCL